MGLGLSLTSYLGRGDTHDADMPEIMTSFDHFRPKCRHATACEPPRPSSLPRHEDEGESDNEHLFGSLQPVTDQNANVNRSGVRVKK